MSQTFPEGKGVETPLLKRCSKPPAGGRRPSQKVKVLKRKVPIVPVFDEPSRRPSQKVKVLKLAVKRVEPPGVIQSQTFPEGKGVETAK